MILTASFKKQLIFILSSMLLFSISTAEAGKPFYVISDLHFGVGSPVQPKWPANNPCPKAQVPEAGDDSRPKGEILNTEDFRWPVALCGFLKEISDHNPDGADLVIAGDFLELWQHSQKDCPPKVTTTCGCTMTEMERVVLSVLRAHAVEFAALDRFAANPSNRVIVVPGNHDAALMEDKIWSLITAAMPSAGERLIRASTGTWFSSDRRIAVEHGHQHQVPDVNAFPNWDNREVTHLCVGVKRFFVTWGERFVHDLYTDIEMKLFPVIDNLTPDSAGVAVYASHVQLERRTAQEWLRFITFNLFETSFYQKLQLLTAKDRPVGPLSNNEITMCKGCLGSGLILRAAEANPILKQLIEKQNLKESIEFRAALEEQYAELSLDQARLLCERVAALDSTGAITDADGKPCEGTLSTAISKLLDPNGEHMLERRVNELYNESKGNLEYYVYGHTHEAKLKMPVRLEPRNVLALNTGAFQRLIDKQNFDTHPNRKSTDSDPEFLSRLTHDNLAPCYSVVEIKYEGSYPQATLRQWFMEESGSQGKFLDACSALCTARPANCD